MKDATRARVPCRVFAEGACSRLLKAHALHAKPLISGRTRVRVEPVSALAIASIVTYSQLIPCNWGKANQMGYTHSYERSYGKRVSLLTNTNSPSLFIVIYFNFLSSLYFRSLFLFICPYERLYLRYNNSYSYQIQWECVLVLYAAKVCLRI